MTTQSENKDRLIALAITLLAVVLMLLFLTFEHLTWDSKALSEPQHTAELQQPEDDEIFLEPELMNLGEEEAVNNDIAAPSPHGEPEQAEVENNKIVVKGENPKPSQSTEKLVTQKKESTVKTTEPAKTDKEEEKISSTVAKGFSAKNGTSDGKSGSAGSGGTGTGVAGSVRGRVFQGCPLPDVTLQHKTVVVVNIVVDENGNVTSASATGSAGASIRRACERAALKAKWSAKKGATETRGTLTFTITPKTV
jgi:outer membrane biosynthesis protein TonB